MLVAEVESFAQLEKQMLKFDIWNSCNIFIFLVRLINMNYELTSKLTIVLGLRSLNRSTFSLKKT